MDGEEEPFFQQRGSMRERKEQGQDVEFEALSSSLLHEWDLFEGCAFGSFELRARVDLSPTWISALSRI